MNRIFERALDKIKHFEKMFPGSTIRSITFGLNSCDFKILTMVDKGVEYNVNGVKITFIEDNEQLTF